MDKRTGMSARGWMGLCLPLALALSGCGEGKASAPSQVLARVNDKEITVLQLNYALAQNASLPAAQQRSKQAILDDLVQQELLVQLAEEKKLDRNPNVLQAMEFARRQVLAQAAASQVASQVGEPSAEEIAAFYKQNAPLFAERKLFRVEAFLLNLGKVPQEVLADLNVSQTPQQTMEILKRHHIEYANTQNTAPAEVFPPDLIQQMSKMKIGDIAAVTERGKVVLLQLLEIQPSPIALAQAQESIANRLRGTRMQQAGTSTLADLRKQAKVEILQDFSAEQAAPAKMDKANEHLLSGLEGLK